ncbi:polyprenyl synthetase family protein [Botrimarina hoheduenensis]|uniref:Heptaprenyl diphosphate synthase component 2 n=1 Tax=Botrimarina hoheduenensis TaxID=2528000 RepID=A0A5C5WD55_9BACT|nr:polyprenyl synthetase family protein [Botrimarina hoheduenensis]TWT48610.1 Heptaprenyl diphosphate synthase component 2 [Botrimarina hoheduenensis]
MRLPLPTKTGSDATPAPTGPAVRLLFNTVGDALARVEERLQAELRSDDPRVDAVVRHGYRLGGKRLRPALVLLAGDAIGSLTPDHDLLAVVVEMIHTATLVHDDVLDEASLRRHVDTVNARWGNETSVLLGDFLFSHAFYLASTIEDSARAAEACRLIGRSTNRVCHGELRQTLSEGELNLSEADYLAIIDGKTAELCACCCRLGALFAGADQQVTAGLEAYGRNLGMAFQIADDLLDLVGEEEETGKTAGADLAKQKITLPLIYTRDSLVNGPRNSLETWLRAPSTTSRAEVRKLVEAVGGVAYAQRRAQEYAELAVSELAVLPAGSARDTLAQLAYFASRRDA